jgi:tripartite-type tricarboxylate transporter receptor subunit TctC
MAGVKLLHVPFRGDSASLTALLGGEIGLVVAPPTAVLGHLKAGKLRALATTGAQRWAAMPEVPTVAEQSVAGFDVTSWAGWMLPAGAPQSIVDRLNAETHKATPRRAGGGGAPRGSTPQEMAAMVAAEVKKWSQVVGDARITRL